MGNKTYSKIIIVLLALGLSLIAGLSFVNNSVTSAIEYKLCAMDVVVVASSQKLLVGVLLPIAISIVYLLSMSSAFQYQYIVRNGRNSYWFSLVKRIIFASLVCVLISKMVCMVIGMIRLPIFCNYSENYSYFSEELAIINVKAGVVNEWLILLKGCILDVLEVSWRVMLFLGAYCIFNKPVIAIIVGAVGVWIIPFRLNRYNNYIATAQGHSGLYVEQYEHNGYVAMVALCIVIFLTIILISNAIIKRKSFVGEERL